MNLLVASIITTVTPPQCELNCNANSNHAISTYCMNNTIDPKYLKIIAANATALQQNAMTGNLILQSGAKVCNSSGSACIDLTEKKCPNGQIMVGFNPDANGGQPVCKSIACPANKYFTGFDPTTGLVKCSDLPPGGTCPPGQYVKQINPDGTIVCDVLTNTWVGDCGTGKYISAISTTGVRTCVDNVNTNLYGKNCLAHDQCLR